MYQMNVSSGNPVWDHTWVTELVRRVTTRLSGHTVGLGELLQESLEGAFSISKRIKIAIPFWPFNAQEDTGVPFHWNFNSILRRDHLKNFLLPSRLWVGRRKEPILGYVPKNDEKNNLVREGLI